MSIFTARGHRSGEIRRNAVFLGKMQKNANKELQLLWSEGARNTLIALSQQPVEESNADSGRNRAM